MLRYIFIKGKKDNNEIMIAPSKKQVVTELFHGEINSRPVLSIVVTDFC